MTDQTGLAPRTRNRLLQTGTVTTRRSRGGHYRIGAEEASYLDRQGPLLVALRRALRTEPTVRLALLYGSQSRGDHKPGSDVDLAVSLGRPPRLGEVAGLRARLTKNLGRAIDLIPLEYLGDPRDLANVLDEARPVIDRDCAWPALRSRLPQVRAEAGRAHHQEVDFVQRFLAR